MEQVATILDEIKKRISGHSKGSRLQVDELLRHDRIRPFVERHPEIPKDLYARSSTQLHQMTVEQDNCSRCLHLSGCPNMQKGHFTTLHSGEYGYLDFRMQPCQRLEQHRSISSNKVLTKSFHIADEIRGSKFDMLDHDRSRVSAIEAAVDFCGSFVDSKMPSKGLYLYGPLGTGKSMIAAAIAQYLVRYGIGSYMVYLPEFMREIKRAIKDGLVEEKIQELKDLPVVILDDIGAEVVTAWTRDEVLGAILQYRTSVGLPTIYTSNLDLDELEEHLSYANRTGSERMKAKRIMERITHFVHPIMVGGPNRRLKR